MSKDKRLDKSKNGGYFDNVKNSEKYLNRYYPVKEYDVDSIYENVCIVPRVF